MFMILVLLGSDDKFCDSLKNDDYVTFISASLLIEIEIVNFILV